MGKIPPIHYLLKEEERTSCGLPHIKLHHIVSSDPMLVNCARCKKTKTYQSARGHAE